MICVIHDDNKNRVSQPPVKLRNPKLFKPYEMGKGGKFGLGLSIVAKVVSANGYEVVGENMAEGVIFRIYKPKNPVKKGR